jgi:hypothetical protein
MRVELHDIRKHLPKRIDLLISSAGFEDRGKSIISELESEVDNCILFKYPLAASPVISEYKKLGKRLNVSKIDTTEPLETTDTLFKKLSVFFSKHTKPKVVVDITTFHREGLLILLRILYELRLKFDDLYFVYNPASHLGSWLSAGVTNIRAVNGYAGEMKPSRQTHAVVLLGFEIERARTLIETYEPQLISIGVSKLGKSENSHFFKRNMEFVDQLTSYYGNQVSKFNISLDDPIQTRNDISKHLQKYKDHNTVLIPLNNKISTLGAGLLALSNPSIQIAYAQATAYNLEDFSKPSQDCHIFELRSKQIWRSI